MTHAATVSSPERPLTLDNPTVLGLLAASRAVLGCGLGMLVAGKIQRSGARNGTAIALLSLGLLANVPSVTKFIVELLNRPDTARGMRKRLSSIRGDVGDYRTDQDHELF
ncbi:MAG: hypothetical protein JO117_02870 [Verrucomicrobia bacterium]|nr:hypothetical protein [Verrucomicrobiota bacterium]MBV9658676.1 hypothetical protein [Verrucomicrobiota bacterium]